MHTLAKFVIAVLLCLSFLGWAGVRIKERITFEQNVEGHLKRASDANTINLAEKELAGAIAYLEKIGMTSGYTSVLWKTPDEDIGFWYQNLKASLEELHMVPKEATQLEKSNILIKLRETLVDHGEGGVEVTAPHGASIFPNNTMYFWWGVIGLVFFIGGVIIFLDIF